MAKRRRFTKLTRRQRLFVDAMNHGAPSATAAARQAGFSPRGIRYAASRLRNHPKIKRVLRPTTRELLDNPRTQFRTIKRLMRLHGVGMPTKVEVIEAHVNARQELARLQREIGRLLGGR